MLYITSMQRVSECTCVKAVTETCVYYLAEALLATARNKTSVYCCRGTFSAPLVMFAYTRVHKNKRIVESVP